MEGRSGEQQGRKDCADVVARNIEKGVQGKSAAANHRREAQQSIRSRLERETPAEPPDKKGCNEQGREPPQFHRNPEPVTFRMRSHILTDGMGLRRAENVTEVRQTDAGEWRPRSEIERVAINGEAHVRWR